MFPDHEILPDDSSLVLSARNGDDSAFAELVRRHKDRIFRLAFRFTASNQDMEDLAQEIFIQAHRKLASFRGEAPFEHWLSRLAHARCCDWWKQHRRNIEEPISPDFLASLEDPSPKQSLSRENARQLIHAALLGLSPEDRLVITLLELDEKSVRDIACLTGWSEGAVKVRAHRAREKMAQNLRKTHGRP